MRTSLLAAITAFTFANAADAQVSVAFVHSASDSVGGTMTPWSNFSGGNTTTSNSLTARLSGDQTLVLPPTPSGAFFRSSTIVAFTVGATPVQVSNFRYDLNCKLVNGNGNFDLPYAAMNAGFFIKQSIDPLVPNPGSDPTILVYGFTGTKNGNGYQVFDAAPPSDFAPFVLGAGLTYYLAVAQITTISGLDGYSGAQVATTLEYGGEQTADTYRGLSASFDWVTVPTPGTASLLAIAGVTALRRRR